MHSYVQSQRIGSEARENVDNDTLNAEASLGSAM